MKWAGYRSVAFSSIKMDVADIRRRSKATHVAELAQNIRDTADELIHAPTVRTPGNVLVAGRDRMAALLILKTKKLWVRVVECTDAEATNLKAWENVHRRAVDRDAELADAVRATEAVMTERLSGTAVPDTAPRRSVTVEARKAVARAAGIKPASVKKAEQRAAAKDSAGDSSGPPPNVPPKDEPPALSPPPIDLLGTPQLKGNASYDFVRVVQAPIDEADRCLRFAQAALKRLENVANFADVAQQLYADVHRVASRVRSHRPWSICPWCKCLPSLVRDCNGCSRRGWVPEEVARRAPPEVLDAGAPAVVHNGVFVAYADAYAGRWPKNGRSAPAKGKGISVELPDGSEADLTVEYDEERA